MKHLIDKSALVAEIERRRDLHYKYYMKNGVGSIAECKYDEDRDILSFLDTLEVKEVYLDEEITIAMPHRYSWSGDGTTMLYTEKQMKDFAKRFFELGLKATQKGEEV